MKSYKYSLIILISLLSLSTFAQTSKKTLNYQAVILDPKAIDIPGASITGQPLNKGNVCLRFSLLNAQGGLDYEETQQVTTDEFGLVSVAIGVGTQGNSTSMYKSFESVQWNASVKSLKVSVSYDACASFKQVSTQSFNYTPYALYAEAVDYKNVREAPTKLSQFSNDAGYLIPKDLDPLKTDIKTNSSQIATANQTIADNKQVSDATFLVVNQSLTSIDKQVAANTSSITTINTKITDQQNQISDNRNQIAATNSTMNAQIGGLQGQINNTNNTVSNLTGVAEMQSNKSTASDLGGANPSDQAYPSQKAAKAYVDQVVSQIATSGVPDATTLAAGKVQLAGDLGGTATNPTVPGLATKENSSNKSTAIDLGAGNSSDQLYPSQKATKAYVDNSIYAAVGTGVPDATTNAAGKVKLAGDLAGTASSPTVPGLLLKANIVSPTFTGTPTAPTPATTDNSTQIATTAFVQNKVNAGTVNDATNTAKGIIKLVGDLGGTADLPTIDKIQGKSVSISNPTSGQVLTYDGTSWANVAANASYSLTMASSSTLGGIKVGNNLSIDGSGVLSANIDAANISGTVAVAKGGTGLSSLTANNVLLGNGASALQVVAPGASGNVLTSNGTTWSSSAPQNLANTISGQVPVANGGTGMASLALNGAIYASSTTTMTSGTLPLTHGGTGATTAGAALTSLGAQSTANLSTDITTDANSTTKYPSVNSIKTYVDDKFRYKTDEFNVTVGSTTSFTLTQTPLSTSIVHMVRNGVRLSNTAFSIVGKAITYIPANNGGSNLVVNDRIQFDYIY